MGVDSKSINWAGPGIASVSIVTFIICLAPIIANTTQGLISVDENLVQLFLMYKASPAQVLLKLRLPHADSRCLEDLFKVAPMEHLAMTLTA
jgi:NitT/TauT family transport system permease protein